MWGQAGECPDKPWAPAAVATLALGAGRTKAAGLRGTRASCAAKTRTTRMWIWPRYWHTYCAGNSTSPLPPFCPILASGGGEIGLPRGEVPRGAFPEGSWTFGPSFFEKTKTLLLNPRGEYGGVLGLTAVRLVTVRSDDGAEERDFDFFPHNRCSLPVVM